MPEAVIVSTARTPIGRAFKGSLIEMRPDDLAAIAVKAALAKVPNLDPSTIEDLMIGCAQPAGEHGYNMGRVVSLLSGLDSPGTTVNRYCSSSLQTIRMAAHAIKAGEGDVFVAAGVECVSRFGLGKSDGMDNTKNPKFTEAEERMAKLMTPDGGKWDPAGGLANVYITMLQTAENVAQYMAVSRQDQDEFAALSQQRAEAAQKSGHFAEEITPVTTPSGNVVDTDDCPRHGTTAEKLAGLKPVLLGQMGERATVTAGNACPLNDGAAAVIVMSDTRAKELGITPLARVVSTGVSALNPEIMGLGPIDATKQALGRAGLTIKDIDLVEINEAFAAQVIPSARELGIPVDKLNVNGGAIALGHPFGQTGARIMTTLIHNLQSRDGRYGVETMCVGGGQGMAAVIERLG
ncbi:MAG: acetyl-CoA C-acetyltransferase [Deltaproteobacteria bacterium]|nr:acetyl-CoA C-acetyltransferase [Deltaproteobacteria bacterium]MBW1874412.1 acetyl-CoA C-acetyltransferase [Deltaproteobacteria bacterium]MBW2209602.1 acetyl-CoA C-acetyltransferase [Deltaproteobacteria bacterium]MBW2214036.1 acetyl-CoA C-acetyltransferase [Deltaproteobacteria bacterium]MBW2378323.1 acetyl-CoA C-acetyltransferase [Deltaproteobacteria bacterium]